MVLKIAGCHCRNTPQVLENFKLGWDLKQLNLLWCSGPHNTIVIALLFLVWTIQYIAIVKSINTIY